MTGRFREAIRGRGPAIVACLTALVAGTTTLLRYLTFHSPAYDLGFFDQVAEQTARGHLFASSFVPYSFLGEHWEPLLGLVAQLDHIVPTPIWLLMVQAVGLGAAPLGAARLAKVWLPTTPHAPLIAAVAMACSPLLTSGGAYDYHTEALTPAVALFALEAAANGRRLRFALLLLVLATIKEDALLVVAGVGWIAWRADGRRIWLLATGAGATGFVIVIALVMPFFRNGAPLDVARDYAWLAGGSMPSVPAMLIGAGTHPLAVVEHLLSADALRGWAVAFLPLALLPLLSRWALLGALPTLLVALLSTHSYQSTLQLQYGLNAAPLLVACALLGWRSLGAMPGIARSASVVLAATSLVGYIVVAPLPGGTAFVPATVEGLTRYAAVEGVLALIPPNASVSASSGLVAHLSDRATILVFPGGIGAKFIVVDKEDPVSRRPGEAKALNSLPAAGYQVIASAGGVTLWEYYAAIGARETTQPVH